MKQLFLAFSLFIFSFSTLHAQTDSTSATPPDNWFNLDLDQNGILGVSTERAYNELLKDRDGKQVIVAVIDSGIDTKHEDLQGSIWINEDEIAGNGIDDDGNGYIDDIHGWNFLGNANGENVVKDTYEITRELVRLNAKYASIKKVKKKDKDEFKYYQAIRKEYESEKSELEQQYQQYKGFRSAYLEVSRFFDSYYKGKEYTEEDIRAIDPTTPAMTQAKGIMLFAYMNGLNEKEMQEADKYFDKMLNYALNANYESRSIVGDNYSDTSERHYGNNDVKGSDATHGTHIAGIIAANRNNSLGVKGVASNTKIMVLRAVPDGDERDKDIANAIYYAVNNGAQIINMSFGKDYSPQKEVVDEAVKYAEKNNVLLIHAAGNDASNLDEGHNFPNRMYQQKGNANNWIEVGASSHTLDKYLPSDFSNYGQKSVDVFAPGVAIYSTTPDQTYEHIDGTSMAAPVVSGIAAVLMSYFPDLSAKEVKEIILSSANDYSNLEVNLPSNRKTKTTTFEKLSATGGVVNAYNAVKMALDQ